MPVSRSATPGGGERGTEAAIRRRVVNTAVLAVATSWITGCTPTPDPREGQRGSTSEPGSTVRSQTPRGDLADHGVLNTTLAHSRALTDLCGDVLDQSPKRLPAVTEVSRVLSIHTAVLSRLVQAGPLPGGDSSALGTGAPAVDEVTEQAPTPSPAGLARRLATRSSTSVLREELSTISAANIATLMSLHGTRRACVELLTGDEPAPRFRGPSGPGAITALAGLRQCQYGLQVLAARADGPEQTTYLGALRRLRDATGQLTELAGPAAPAAPLGYGLPNDLGTAGERRALAQDLLLAAMQAVIAGSAARSGDPAAIEGTVSLMSVVCAVGISVGVPLTGFPGMTVPSTDP